MAELLVVVAILTILAAIAIPLFLNQKKKAADGVVRSDLHNIGTDLASLYTGTVTTITGSDGTLSANLTVDGMTVDKKGARVYANNTGQWCVSKVSTSGHIFAITSTNRSVYEATTNCVAPSTQPTGGSGGGGTIISEEGNLLTANQATPSAGYNANRGTISYNSGIGTVISNNATPLSTYSFTNPTNTNFVPGQTYTVTANITATVGSSGFVYIQWYDAGSVGVGTVLGTTIPEGSTGISTGTGVAPPTAAYFRILVQMSNSVTGDSVSYNQVGF